jgi:hypothetical protein
MNSFFKMLHSSCQTYNYHRTMTLMKTWIGFISSKIQPSVKIKWLKLRRMITLGALVMPVGFVTKKKIITIVS